MPVRSITPEAAAELVQQGAILVDIRNPDEYVRRHIEGARNLPLGQLSGNPAPGQYPVIFYCLSGARTQHNVAVLSAVCAGHGYLLEGGLQGWQQAGLPVVEDRRQPMEIMRQVQIAAGSLILLGCVLGASVTPGFYLISAFVGAGLVFAGISGFCGMAKVLAKMPWNRPRG